MRMKIAEKYNRRVQQINSLLCVGLDADLKKIPDRFLSQDNPLFAFNKWIIDQTHIYTAAYKPNLAFYESEGIAGWKSLQLTVEYLQKNYPEIVTIADAKRGDIGNTNFGYVKSIFDDLGFDAVTLHPYLGQESLAPFLERIDKASIILCKTSNPGGGELQDLLVEDEDGSREPMWLKVAKQVSQEWNQAENCMLVVGATYPKELAKVRQVVGEMTILVPGIGAQGGELKSVLKAGLNTNGQGLIINIGRDIIFDENPGERAKWYSKQIRTP